jgi:hypothetical protein
MSFLSLILLHTLFEIMENTSLGIKFINKYIFLWPGGKTMPDSIINNLGDTLSVIIGWYSSLLLDNKGEHLGWYKSHINNK